MAYFDADRRRTGLLPPSGSMNAPPGVNSTAEYIVSGLPFVSSSAFNATTTYEMEFPAMTQWFYVENLGNAAIDLGFTAAGVAASNKWTIAATTTSPKFEVRTKSVFLVGTNLKTYQVVAGLTQVPSGSVPDYSANSDWGR
jgi:hypothetical protein